MRSSKAPPNQKNRGQVLPTPPNLASEPDKCNARRGYLGTSQVDPDLLSAELIYSLLPEGYERPCTRQGGVFYYMYSVPTY